MSNDCSWSRFFSHSKNHGQPPTLRTLHASDVGELCDPVVLVSIVHGRQERESPDSESGVGLERLPGRPQFNYEPFNSNSVNIRSWSWNYRGCWHQTCPPIGTRCSMGLNIPHWNLPNTGRC